MTVAETGNILDIRPHTLAISIDHSARNSSLQKPQGVAGIMAALSIPGNQGALALQKAADSSSRIGAASLPAAPAPKVRAAPQHSHILVCCGEKTSGKVEPYVSEKHFPVLSLNGEALTGGMPICCRHLCTILINLWRKNRSAKTSIHECFGSIDSILKNADSYRNLESQYDKLKMEASKHIIANNGFGRFLSEQAMEMVAGDKKWFLIQSSNHALAVELEYKTGSRKGIPAENRFVVRFFDPNDTNVKVRCEVSHAADFNNAAYSLRNFTGRSDYSLYFGEITNPFAEKECIIYDCTDPKEPGSEFITLEADSAHGISPAMMHHLMYDGSDPDAIREIARSQNFKSLSSDERHKILLAKRNNGTTGLYIAICSNNVKVIEAYGELLDALSPEERIAWLPELLAARNQNGMTGLSAALYEDCADAISAYGKLLDKLTPQESAVILPWLLTSVDQRGAPGLYYALREGHPRAIFEYEKLLDKLISLDVIPLKERAMLVYKLLRAQKSDGTSGLFTAMAGEKTEAILSFAILVKKFVLMNALTRDDYATCLYKLLSARDSNNIPGLYFALKYGLDKTILAYAELLDVPLTRYERKTFLGKLLAALHPDRTPGLFMALQNRYPKAVIAYGKLLEMLTPDEHTMWTRNLLAAEQDGVRGFTMALKGRDNNTIRAYMEVYNKYRKSISK